MPAYMHYLAVTPDGAIDYFSKLADAKQWAQDHGQIELACYRNQHRCVLLGLYARHELYGWFRLPMPESPQYYYPADAAHESLALRRKALLEWRRPAPDMLTRGEFARLHQITAGRVDTFAHTGKLSFVKHKGIRWYQRDQELPPVRRKPGHNYDWSRNYPACVKCGTTSIIHTAQGLCSSCYQTLWRQKGQEQQRKWAQLVGVTK